MASHEKYVNGKNVYHRIIRVDLACTLSLANRSLTSVYVRCLLREGFVLTGGGGFATAVRVTIFILFFLILCNMQFVWSHS